MASAKHRVLIVGAGSIGERHLRCFQATGRASLSFVEISPALRQTIGERYGVPGFASLDEALANTADAMGERLGVIATPAPLHVSQATTLVSAGWHALIEKPLSTGSDGCTRLAELAHERNVVVAVAYVYRAFPALAAMREAIVGGRFGRPVELVAVCGQNFPTYRPAYRDTYYADRATGGGAIQDALTHLLNAGEWILGPIDRLVADAAHRVLPDVTVEDTVHLLARHGSVLASYNLNQHQAPNETTLTVVCEQGTVRWESHCQRWRWMVRPDEPWHEELHEPLPRDAAFIAQAQRFIDAVERKAQPACSLAEGLQTLRVNRAALASLESRGWRNVGDAP